MSSPLTELISPDTAVGTDSSEVGACTVAPPCRYRSSVVWNAFWAAPASPDTVMDRLPPATRTTVRPDAFK